MKLSLVFNPNDCKLVEISYSQTYRDQWLALGRRFEQIQPVTEPCSAKDIDGDVVVFYDPHSTHHIEIDGISNHKSLKYEYMDDPNQEDRTGIFQKTGQAVHKLGASQRIRRALERGIDYIVCPYTESYFEHFGDLLKDAESKLAWFPASPDIRRFRPSLLKERRKAVLANGSTRYVGDFDGYEFRKWAFEQPEVEFVKHCMDDKSTPRGIDYPQLLQRYAGALALCDTHTPPKYLEIPMAGCVCFAQYQRDYMKMGFKDRENCIFVNKVSFHDLIEDFKSDVESYQHIADAGRKTAENWTAEKFADYIYEHAKERLNGSN